jgi:hypothetical protein
MGKKTHWKGSKRWGLRYKESTLWLREELVTFCLGIRSHFNGNINRYKFQWLHQTV